MDIEKEKWFVLVVSTDGHLVPTPEHLAPKNTMYLDDEGAIRDYRTKPTILDQEVPPVDDTAVRIKHLLENRKSILVDAARLSVMGDTPDDIEALTVQAVDFSRLPIKSQQGGEAAQNLMVNIIDNDQIAKEQARQRADRRQAIEAAREQADDIYLLDELILMLPYKHRGILQDTYYFNFTKADLKEIYKSNYPKRRDAAIWELSEQYKADVRRVRP